MHIDCCYNIYELGVEGVVYVKGGDIGGEMEDSAE